MSEAQIYADSVRATGDTTEKARSRSPFQDLKGDILIEICLQATTTLYDDSRVDDDDKSPYKSQFTREKWAKTAPVNVSAVCQHWRAVSLSSRSLWTTFAGCDDDDMIFPWEYLDMFLLRSRNAPFNLTIRSFDMDYDRLLAIFNNNNNLSRLKTFDIDYDWNAIPEEPWRIELVNMPSLETLRLTGGSSWNADAHIRVQLADAPILHHLFLTGGLVLCYNEQLLFENLTHIALSGGIKATATSNNRVHDLSWYDCLLIMQASPSLEAFLAEDIKPHRSIVDVNPVKEVPRITLSKLWNLNLKWLNVESARRILDHLCLPSLEEINLHTKGGVSSCGLQALISRSKATIRRLEVNGIGAVEITQCLQCTPALRILSVSGKFDSPELRTLISRLTPTTDTHLCPDLESIAFMDCGDPSQCSEVLTTMICSRWDRSMVGDETCLKYVEFEDLSMDWDFPYSDQLLKACSEGLVIHERKERDVYNEDESETDSSDF